MGLPPPHTHNLSTYRQRSGGRARPVRGVQQVDCLRPVCKRSGDAEATRFLVDGCACQTRRSQARRGDATRGRSEAAVCTHKWLTGAYGCKRPRDTATHFLNSFTGVGSTKRSDPSILPSARSGGMANQAPQRVGVLCVLLVAFCGLTTAGASTPGTGGRRRDVAATRSAGSARLRLRMRAVPPAARAPRGARGGGSAWRWTRMAVSHRKRMQRTGANQPPGERQRPHAPTVQVGGPLCLTLTGTTLPLAAAPTLTQPPCPRRAPAPASPASCCSATADTAAARTAGAAAAAWRRL